ncbi:hypothetical protein I8748_05550 [Nostoc sp. CENA67]|uniref:Uncharacterized protein n=1 Tax=Amazonocrinis nigriterrae CENA67 TaxID=2794033 RepID=A0A8J7HQ48_9NOST|nr:hypothetical protein [Amazonocrinis nigriterrae]MBH8561648.1 hypothetical protein [Amazonocrinis nigriterrae CENA67]
MQLTLQQLFGVNAIQDSQTLVIQKSDLSVLTPRSDNTAESLLTAILLKSLENFEGTLTDENNNLITDENNYPIEYSQDDYYELLKVFEWEEKYFKKRNQIDYFADTLIIQEFDVYED